MVAPARLSVAGAYNNLGTTTHTGTTTFNGSSIQTATGTMTGNSAFTNLEITNTSGQGSSTQSVIFNAPASTTGTLFMRASTSAAFKAGATSTFQNIYLQGSATGRAYLRSTASNTPWGMNVPGTQHLVTYVDVRDSQACSGNPTVSAAQGTSVDAGGNTCWDFGTALDIASVDDQVFIYQGSTSTLERIVITDIDGEVTAANDIRIKISTSTHPMRFDTNDTDVTFGGTASGKILGAVTFEGNGSVIVIPVDSNFSAGDTLTVSGISVGAFTGTTTPQSALALYIDGVSDTSADATDTGTIGISGSLTLDNHTLEQVVDNFDFVTATDVELFAFRIIPGGESAMISEVVYTLSNVYNILTADLTNLRIYRDINSDGLYDVGDVQVGGAGTPVIAGQFGTVTFNTGFQATTTQNYILVGDIADMYAGDTLLVSLSSEDVTATGILTSLTIIPGGSVAGVTHRKGGATIGAGFSEVGGAAPQSDEVTTGGGNDSGGEEVGNEGDTIGNESGFNAPTTNSGSFTNGANAYTSDGAYATLGSTLTHTYGTYSFNLPGNNSITGIEVKLEGKASTAAGTISARISWDNGSSYTSLKTTGTLTTSDAVYALGGQGDTWGHTWTPAETGNGTFLLELTGTPSSNTISLDALQVKVYHQSSGGGRGGGGGGEVSVPGNHYFANVISSFGSVWQTVTLDTPIFGWLMNLFK